MTTFKNFILEELYNHICIELDCIEESEGVPDGLREDAQYIASQIIEHRERHNCRNFIIDINVSKLDLEFDSLKCKIFTENRPSEAKLITKDNFSKTCVLKLYINKEDFTFKKLMPLIGHELLHWHIYVINGEEKSESLFNKRISRMDQNKLFDNVKNSSETIIKGVLYHFAVDELNAFITQITLEIEQERPSSVEEAYQILFKNELYNGYCDLYSALISLSPDELKDVCNIYRDINTHDSYLSDSKILRKLKKQFFNIKKRLIKIIPRIILNNKSVTLK